MGTVALPFCHLRFEAVRPLSNGYPADLLTIGDHIRKRRMDMGLFQRQVADLIGVSSAAVWIWENEGRTPEIWLMPRIAQFLGYVPLEKPANLQNQLRAYRMIRGLTQKQAAKASGIDPSTWWAWEVGLKRPGSKRTRTALRLILQSLDSATWHSVESV